MKIQNSKIEIAISIPEAIKLIKALNVNPHLTEDEEAIISRMQRKLYDEVYGDPDQSIADLV